MRKLPLAKLSDFFALASKGEALYLPVRDKGTGSAVYMPWKEGVEYDGDAVNTLRSAKDFFFPQMETIVKFARQQGDWSVIDVRQEKEDFIVFGARACDVAAFGILDKVFLQDPVDTFYKNRREHGTIVSMGCTRPAATCFCPLYGIDATAADGADVNAWKDGSFVYFEAKTGKGGKLLEKVSSLLEEDDGKAVEEQKAAVKPVLDKLPYAHLDMSVFKGENMKKLFASPKWDELSSACLGCGTCTFVCPTCQCFDIHDYDTGHGVERYRCWDSCMYSEFTKMAAANPRLTQKERFRQRFMHKLVYYPMDYEGAFSCVGCGRCLERCPIHMHIAKVIKALGEEA